MNNGKVVVYCRTAHSDPISLETQRVGLTTYAEENGFQIVTAITECGSGLDYSRKGLEEITHMAERGEMDHVLIANIDRLGRDTLKRVEFICRLKDRNVDVICANGTIVTRESLEWWRALGERYEGVLNVAK